MLIAHLPQESVTSPPTQLKQLLTPSVSHYQNANKPVHLISLAIISQFFGIN